LFAQLKEVHDNNVNSLFVKWDSSGEMPKNSVLHLTSPKLDTVKIAIIGLGNRGEMALERLTQISNVKIIAIADLDSNKVNKSLEIYFKNKSISTPLAFYEPNDWQLICQRNDIDLVYVCTHWKLHTPIAVYAMEHNKHVAVEVPAALTLEECWKLVRTAEKN
jgi:predicted dehydrogenase